MVKNESNYILITAAKNEEDYIEKTIQSVITQTIVPKKWIIVSDGSTDHTDDIVNKYAGVYEFIQLIHIDSDNKRNFSSKVNAFNIGYKHINNIEHEFVGNLDADVSFESDYYERILTKFRDNSKLGIAGGGIFELYAGKFRKVISNLLHVSGAVQLFRKQCYEDIKGYIPIDRGGEDAIAGIMARMQGWEVKRFPNIRVLHHRRADRAKGNIFFGKFSWGVFDFSVGCHPIYTIVKFFNRLRERPYILASLFRLSGYCFALIKKEPRILPDEVVKFIRQVQMQRIREIMLRIPIKVYRKLNKGF